MIITIDGVRTKLQAPDIDGNGRTDTPERIVQRFQPSGGTTPIIQPTELGESLKYLNDDSFDFNTRVSDIDMKARLHPMQVAAITAWEWLVKNNGIPENSGALTRLLKRNSVSIKGLGRQEMVDMVRGKKEQDIKMAGGGMMNNIKSGLGLGGK